MGDAREAIAVHLHALAHIEISEALEYYEACRSGCGQQLDRTIRNATARIGRFPTASSMWKNDPTQRITALPHFPFLLPYELLEEKKAVVLALAHTSRSPGYWLDRATPR